MSWPAMGRSPSRLQLYLLITRKVGSYPYTAGSFLQSCVANSPNENRLCLFGPAYPVRASIPWASSWVPRGNIPHSSPRTLHSLSCTISLLKFSVGLCHQPSALASFCCSSESSSCRSSLMFAGKLGGALVVCLVKDRRLDPSKSFDEAIWF